MTKHLFTLPIGDYGGDGHALYERFVIRSNRPVEEVREIFKKMDSEVHLTSLFEEYEQNTITEFEYERLISKVPEAAEFFGVYEGDYELELGADSAVELFIECMMAYDSALELDVVQLPNLNEASFGYGLFSN